MTSSVSKTHFEQVHPVYNVWRRGFRWKVGLGFSSGLILFVIIGLAWGFGIQLSTLQGEILSILTVPMFLVMIQANRMNRRFRQEWVSTHGMETHEG